VDEPDEVTIHLVVAAGTPLYLTQHLFIGLNVVLWMAIAYRTGDWNPST
jgi:hypothetical protein